VARRVGRPASQFHKGGVYETELYWAPAVVAHGSSQNLTLIYFIVVNVGGRRLDRFETGEVGRFEPNLFPHIFTGGASILVPEESLTVAPSKG